MNLNYKPANTIFHRKKNLKFQFIQRYEIHLLNVYEVYWHDDSMSRILEIFYINILSFIPFLCFPSIKGVFSYHVVDSRLNSKSYQN